MGDVGDEFLPEALEAPEFGGIVEDEDGAAAGGAAQGAACTERWRAPGPFQSSSAD